MFKNSEELAKYVSIPQTMPFNVFKAALPIAEQSAEKLVSSPVYQTLKGGVFEKKWENEYNNLLELVKRYIAFLSLTEAFVDIRNKASGQGLQQVSTDSEGMDRPSTIPDAMLWVQTYNKRAFQVADQILEFLEKNIHAFEAWTFSDSFTEDTSLFVRRTADFTEQFAQVRSRQVYLALRSYLRTCEKLVIKPLLGNALYLDLKNFVAAQLKNENLSSYPLPSYTALIEAIQPVSVFYSVVQGLIFLPISFEAEGVYLNHYEVFSTKKQSIDYRATEAAKQNAEHHYQLYKKQLEDFLAENQVNLPKLPTKEVIGRSMPDNANFKSGFRM